MGSPVYESANSTHGVFAFGPTPGLQWRGGSPGERPSGRSCASGMLGHVLPGWVLCGPKLFHYWQLRNAPFLNNLLCDCSGNPGF